MSSWQLGIDLVTTFLLASYVLFQYGNWYRHHTFVTLSVLVAWYFSFVFVFVLPIDISGTAYRACLASHNATIPPSSNTTTTTVVPTSMIQPPSSPPIPSNLASSFHQPQQQQMQHLSSLSPLPQSLPQVSPSSSPGAEDMMSSNNSRSNNHQQPPTQPPSPPPPPSPVPVISPCTMPPSYVPEYVMQNLWRVVYWTSQLLTWLILPMMQSYVQAGEFTIKGKLRSALLDNAIYYGSYLFICGILLAYIAVKPDLELDWYKLKAIASSASNTWGLFLLVFMLGYGLVSVPQAMYHSSCEKRSLNNAYFRVAKLNGERCNSEEAVDDVIETLQLCVKSTNSLSPQLANNLQTVVSTLPLEMREKMARRRVNETINEVNEKLLVKLHRNVKRALQAYNRTETQYEEAITHAIYLEDVDRNMHSSTRIFKRTFEGTPTHFVWRHLPNSVEWFIRCVAHSYVLKGVSLLACLLSLMIVWSEVTFFNRSPVLSFFAIMLNGTRSAYPTMEFICTITIAYMATCAFYTIFKIRVFNFYYLAPKHMTDEYSLIFAGMLLCRLTPPLCLNTLSLFHLDSHVIQTRIHETSYTQVMGHMDIISIISDGFNIYFPIGILGIALLTYFRVGSRLLSQIGFQQYLPEDDIVADLVSEGAQLVVREKRRRQRNMDTTGAGRKTARSSRGDRGGGPSSASAVESANVAVENLRNLSSSGPGGGGSSSSGGALVPDDEETYYSRVLIEDSSSSNQDLQRNRVRVYGTGTSSPPQQQSTHDPRYYYQRGGSDALRGPPRGLFDDV